MTDLSQQLLHALARDGWVSSFQFAAATGQDHQRVVGAIKSLESLGNVSKYRDVRYAGHIWLGDTCERYDGLYWVTYGPRGIRIG